jgi:hypothetical protein
VQPPSSSLGGGGTQSPVPLLVSQTLAMQSALVAHDVGHAPSLPHL